MKSYSRDFALQFALSLFNLRKCIYCISGWVQVNSPEPRVGAGAGRAGRREGVCGRGGPDQSVALSGTASRCERDARWQTYEQRLAVVSAYPGRDKGLAWFFCPCVDCCFDGKNHDRPAAGIAPQARIDAGRRWM